MCRNDAGVVGRADFLENIMCSFKNGIDDPESSCLFYNIYADSYFINQTVLSCALQWSPINIGASDNCPPLIPQLNTSISCQEILMQTYNDVGCCYVNFVRSEDLVRTITE